MKKKFIGSVIIIMMILAGCTSMPLVNTFMDPDVPREGHAVLSVDNNIVIAMLDGQMTLKSSGSGNEGVILEKNPLVVLTPGEHYLHLQYFKRSESSTAVTTESTDFITIKSNFQAGHFYRIYPRFEGTNVHFEIIDVTDPNALNNPKIAKESVKWVGVAKKKLETAKYPKKIAIILVMQKAATAEPSPLEGTWAYNKEALDLANSTKYVSGITDMEYTFTGNTFTVKTTKELTDQEFNQINAMNKILKTPPLRSKEQITGQRGTIEVAGNAVTFTYLQTSNDSVGWITSLPAAQIKAKYTYSFGKDGNLLLSMNNGEPIVLVKRK